MSLPKRVAVSIAVHLSYYDSRNPKEGNFNTFADATV